MRRIFAAIIAMALLTLGSADIGAGAELVTFYVVDRQPFAMVSDPTDGRVYVANSGALTPFGTGRVSVIDPATNTVTSLETTKPAGLLALDATARRLYSSNFRPSPDSVSLDVIDLNTGTRVTSLDGLGGLGVALDTSRSRVFVAGGRYLAAVDTTTFEMNIRMAPFPQSWFGVATDPTLGRVYVTNINSASPSLVVLDANDLHTLANISLPSVPRWALAVDETTHTVYVAGSDPTGGTASTVSSLNAATFALHTEPLGFFPAALALEPSMHRVWVTDATNNAIVALDDQTLLAVEPRTSLLEQPSFATFARDGLLYVAGYGGASVSAFRTARVNEPPVVDSSSLTPVSPATNDSVVAVVAAHDPEGGALSYAYEWTVNGTVVTGETSATLDLSAAGHGDRDDAVCVRVTVSDGELSSSATACETVRNTGPDAAVEIDKATPSTDDELRATVTATDADADALTYTYTWRVNGAVTQVRTTASTSDTFDLGLDGHGGSGDTITVSVIASDGDLASAPTTASATVANTAPTASVSISDNRAKKQDVLTATVVASDEDGQALTYSYEWRLNGTLKQTSTGSSPTSIFDLKAAGTTIGDVVTLDVVVSDGAASTTASTFAKITPAGH